MTKLLHQNLLVDFSADHLDVLRKFGIKAYFGDATRPDLLEAAGIRDARILVVAIDGKHQITELVKYVRHNYPSVHIIARAIDRNHVYDLYAAGCRDIIRETYDSSIRTGRSALIALGLSHDVAEQVARGYVEDDRNAMIVLASLYDPDIPNTENTEYIAKVKEVMQLQDELLEQGPSGFGGLKQKLIERGEDPSEIIRQYEHESEQ